MREVYVVGIGITSFTRLEYPLSEIAAYPAMAGAEGRRALEGEPRLCGQHGRRPGLITNPAWPAPSSIRLSLTPAGAEVIENGPASGASAIKTGFMAVASGLHDTVLVTSARGCGR